ncbi:collagen alpha-1(I) chain-like [Canis lupus familiaris]|uniref:collagen alpha-1(I) chain-like n=1 Tax=Canis lupus familiaris TaxID=9615 RepID=UPI0018F4F34A|nr:collagen alpha-1(I) chain-like [Canis lupus familiaris]
MPSFLQGNDDTVFPPSKEEPRGPAEDTAPDFPGGQATLPPAPGPRAEGRLESRGGRPPPQQSSGAERGSGKSDADQANAPRAGSGSGSGSGSGDARREGGSGAGTRSGRGDARPRHRGIKAGKGGRRSRLPPPAPRPPPCPGGARRHRVRRPSDPVARPERRAGSRGSSVPGPATCKERGRRSGVRGSAALGQQVASDGAGASGLGPPSHGAPARSAGVAGSGPGGGGGASGAPAPPPSALPPPLPPARPPGRRPGPRGDAEEEGGAPALTRRSGRRCPGSAAPRPAPRAPRPAAGPGCPRLTHPAARRRRPRPPRLSGVRLKQPRRGPRWALRTGGRSAVQGPCGARAGGCGGRKAHGEGPEDAGGVAAWRERARCVGKCQAPCEAQGPSRSLNPSGAGGETGSQTTAMAGPAKQRGERRRRACGGSVAGRMLPRRGGLGARVLPCDEKEQASQTPVLGCRSSEKPAGLNGTSYPESSGG